MTVVDELILRFSLDATNFNRGQQQTVQSLRKMEEEARSAGKGTEDAAAKMAQGFERVTKEVLSLGATVLGVNGLKDLAVSTTTAAANLGVLTQAINFSSEAMNRWQNVGRQFGVSAETTASTIARIATLQQMFREKKATPQDFGLPSLFALAGVNVSDLANLSPEELLKKVGRGVVAHPADAAGLLSGTPFAPLQPTLMQSNLDALLAKAQSITEDQVQAAEKIRKIFVDIAVRLERAVNRFLPEGLHRTEGVVRGINQIERGNIIEGLGNIDRSLGSDPNTPSLFDWRPRSLPTKDNAGNFNPATAALAEFLQANVPGFQRVTAADDAYHAGRGGHGKGLALDFTIAGGEREYAIAAARLGRIPGLKAINEFAPGSSAGWTAPHLHVQFRDAAAAADFTRAQGGGGGSGINVGAINIYTQPGADPHAIGQAVRGAIDAPQATAGGN